MIGFSGLRGPNAQEIRFMCHVWGQRPHLDVIHGSWRCVGQFTYGYGRTHDEAYRNWLALLPHNQGRQLHNQMPGMPAGWYRR
ncbi:hypothetical protein ABH944_004843 [Caballeronia udeis]|uniref:Uncharacterized protein n=1 Tax=Caballeronia udeis TaxID=1232866 RepID=A0ABW8MLV1_9BURK